MKRNPQRLYTTTKSDKIISKHYNTGRIDDIRVGEIYNHTFGSKQLKTDGRRIQMDKHTPLTLYYNKKNTQKKFIIITIGTQTERINGDNKFNKFNDYVAVLRRVK